MFVCVCRAVSEPAIREAWTAGARSVEDVMAATGAGSVCGACLEDVAACLAVLRREQPLSHDLAAQAAAA